MDLENEFLERSRTYTLEDIQGKGPLKWFELKSITKANKIMGISPWIRLWGRFKNQNLEDKFQNEGGTTSKILVLEMSNDCRCLCEQSHGGNFGPKFHDQE